MTSSVDSRGQHIRLSVVLMCRWTNAKKKKNQWRARLTLMSLKEWESAELLVYWSKHTQRPCRVWLYGMSKTKGCKNGGILSLSDSPPTPLVNQLPHRLLSFSLFWIKKLASWRKLVRSCCVCTPTAELLLGWKSQQMGLIAGSGLSGGEAPLNAAVMQMLNWRSTGS